MLPRIVLLLRVTERECTTELRPEPDEVTESTRDFAGFMEDVRPRPSGTNREFKDKELLVRPDLDGTRESDGQGRPSSICAGFPGRHYC